MKQYDVLVVDDSAFMRRAISKLLERDPQFNVIGIARNGLEAVEKVKLLKPDLVTMDVEMPELNGLGALDQIMKTSPVPIVMLSSRTSEGAQETLQALEFGAIDFFLKETLIKGRDNSDLIQDFLLRLKSIAEAKFPTKDLKRKPQSKELKSKIQQQPDLIFIGCSTGGPSALQKILPHFSKDFQIPIVVAQHMPHGFTKHLANRFDSLCALNVREAQNGQVILPGTIYISPSGYQTRFEKRDDGTTVFVINQQEDEKVLYRPSIDISLSSAAPIYKDRLLSVILTGMGVDGMKGTGLVKRYQGNVIVEAEESCVVYGMPKAVKQAGYADGQYLLSDMYQEIMSFIKN